MTKTYHIKGMDCPNCASMIELDLEDAGCKAKCSYSKSTIEIKGPHDENKVVEIIHKGGYTIK